MEPAKKIRESQELCHGSPEKFSQGVSTELVRPFFQNFKIPNWLSICLSVFHSISTNRTQRSVKYGQDRGEGPPFQRGTAALDPAGGALTRAPGREGGRRAEGAGGRWLADRGELGPPNRGRAGASG